jgi:hypothetical protein
MCACAATLIPRTLLKATRRHRRRHAATQCERDYCGLANLPEAKGFPSIGSNGAISRRHRNLSVTATSQKKPSSQAEATKMLSVICAASSIGSSLPPASRIPTSHHPRLRTIPLNASRPDAIRGNHVELGRPIAGVLHDEAARRGGGIPPSGADKSRKRSTKAAAPQPWSLTLAGFLR